MLPRASPIFGLLLLAGCACAEPLPTYPATTTPEEALAVFAKNHDGWRTLRASVTGNSERGSFSGALFVDRDAGRFRLYAWKLGGAIAIFDLLVEDGELRLFVPRAARLLKRPLDPAAGGLDAIFATLFPDAAVERRAVPRKGGAFQIEERAAGRLVAVWSLAPETLAVVSEQSLTPEGTVRFGLAFSDHRLVAGRVVPGRLELVGKKPLSLALDDIALDEPIDAKKFGMRLSPGTIEVHDPKDLEERAD